MELLLLLSAFLSALTGAISGVRPPDIQVHQASARVAVAGTAIRQPRKAAGRRLVQPLASLRSLAGIASEPVAWFVAASAPLYADRLRE